MKIAEILPKGEGFSPVQFGAIALCVRDFTCHSQYNHDITVLGGTSEEGFSGIDYIKIPQARWYEKRTTAYARGCVNFINSNNVALAEIHNRPNLLHYIAKKAPCRFALHLHNDAQEMKYAKTPDEREALLEICDAIYCVSGYIRDRFLDGIDSKYHHKVHIVYNGIEIPTSLPAKEKLIVFAGRMTEGKGALLLAQALQKTLPQLQGWQTIFIGSGRHEVSDKLTAYEKEVYTTLQPISSQVQMAGFLSHAETLDYFARAEIAVIPSVWQEPFGRTAIEAMSNGCTLISSARGGLAEVTEAAALNISPLSAEVLANAILTLAKNQNERERYQKLARDRAMYFSIAARTNVLDKIREAILSGKPHAA